MGVILRDPRNHVSLDTPNGLLVIPLKAFYFYVRYPDIFWVKTIICPIPINVLYSTSNPKRIRKT